MVPQQQHRLSIPRRTHRTKARRQRCQQGGIQFCWQHEILPRTWLNKSSYITPEREYIKVMAGFQAWPDSETASVRASDARVVS
ncbi:TPA: hypothetical protein ACH3X3_014980 [Trebouxia sp. C0006]